ncbi:hypothetical protein [Sanguibacter sp. 25GB23B1]|uniref:hypothetical protein n=1 Tax=unclassified Sanguibacter TaxID=2645534 RepID=UPI0032AFEA78
MSAAGDVDYAPLTADPTSEDLATLRRSIQAGDLGKPTRLRYGKKQRDGLLVLGLVGGFLGLIFGAMALVSLVRGDTENALIGLWFVGGVIAIGGIAGFFAGRGSERGWHDVWRLVTFARTNGFEVTPEAKVVLLPGTIFTTKANASTSHRVRWTVGGARAEIANHRRSPGGTSFAARYLAIQLPDLPSFSFVGRAKGPARPGLVLGTETQIAGRHANGRGKLTSAAKDAERTRSFFTEEIVDLVTDPEHPCNAEAIGGWFFAYYRTNSGTDEQSWRHAFALADAVVRSSAAAREPRQLGRS